MPAGGDKLLSSASTLQFRFISENKSEKDSFIVVNFFKTNKEKELKWELLLDAVAGRGW